MEKTPAKKMALSEDLTTNMENLVNFCMVGCLAASRQETGLPCPKIVSVPKDWVVC